MLPISQLLTVLNDRNCVQQAYFFVKILHLVYLCIARLSSICMVCYESLIFVNSAMVFVEFTMLLHFTMC